MCVAPLLAGLSGGGYLAGGWAVCFPGGAARRVPGRDDGAEVLGVDRPGLPFGERRGGVRGDPDAGFAVGGVEDVRAVPGRGHPGGDDRLRGGQPQRAPRDVLTDHVPVLRVREVAARAHPLERGFAVGCVVGEVVLFGHVAAVALRGTRKRGVWLQCRLAVAFAFLVDQAQHRGAHQAEVARLRGQVRVGARRGGRGGGDPARHSRAQAGCECEQRCESGVDHGGCIDSRARGPEPGRAGLDTFRAVRARANSARDQAGACGAHPSAGARGGWCGASCGAGSGRGAGPPPGPPPV